MIYHQPPKGPSARWRRIRDDGFLRPSSLVLVAMSMGMLVGAGPDAVSYLAKPDYDEIVSGCRVSDGAAIRCGREQVRLLGIDAPELPVHCPSRRDCAPGDLRAATESLARATSGRMAIRRVGRDRYGRTLAIVSGAKGDLSCWQLSRAHANYRPRWDTHLLVARTCPQSLLG